MTENSRSTEYTNDEDNDQSNDNNVVSVAFKYICCMYDTALMLKLIVS